MNTAMLNRYAKTPQYYWRERGFADGFERESYSIKTGAPTDCSLPSGLPAKLENTYKNSFKSGRKHAKNLHRDFLNGEFSK